MRKKIGSAAIVIVIIMLFGMFFSKTNLFVYAAESQLVINTTVDQSNVNTGDTFTYTLKYANPSTTENSNNVVVTDILPDNVQYVSFQSSADVQSVSQEGNTITFTFKPVLKAGSTGYIKVAAKFPEGTTSNGTTADNVPTIKDDNGIINSNAVTVTAKTLAIPDWNIAKTLVNATTPAGTIYTDSNIDTQTTTSAAVTLTAGQTDFTIDAGFNNLASIGDRVWIDKNGNGVQDSETGLLSITVNLYDDSNTLSKTTVTSSSGYYEFNDLDSGNYQVEFKLPTGYVFTDLNKGGNAVTDSDADLSTGKTSIFTLAVGAVDKTWDAGMYKTVNIGDYVWVDMNNDGKQDSTDIALPGTTVKLYKSSDLSVPFLSTVTDSSGKYSFSNLFPGTYSLKFTPPTYYYTPTTIGATAICSKINVLGEINNISLTSGVNNYTLDAGYLPPTSAIDLQKTVYLGWDNGNNYNNGVETVFGVLGQKITYVFKVTNTGGANLNNIDLDDAVLGINTENMILKSGSLLLTPRSSLYYYYETTITNSLVNTAHVIGTPVDSSNVPINVAKPEDTDTASVVDAIAQIELDKTVYQGHDNGANYLTGTKTITAMPSTPLTYVFKITNLGNTYLSNINLNDTTLNKTQADMHLIAGTLPLAPGQSIYYYFDSELTTDLTNNANVTGTPSNEQGAIIPNTADVTDTSSASVALQVLNPNIKIEKKVYAGNDGGSSYSNATESLTGKANDPITYVFIVTNTGNCNLKDILIDDITLGLNKSNLTKIIGNDDLLIPGDSVIYYYETTIKDNITNTAKTTGTPVYENGVPYSNHNSVTDTSSATVATSTGTVISGGGSSSGGSSSSSSSSGSSNDKIETTRIIPKSTDESGTIDALKTADIKTVIVNVNDSNENVANNTPILTQGVLTSLKASIDKTLIIKNGNSSIEIKGTADGQIQITQNNVPLTGFNIVGNADYYSNSNGIMQKDWINPVGNTWYHLNADTGVKEKNWIQETNRDWYYLDNTSGVMRTSWVNDKNSWYYLKSNGAMKTGWFQDRTKWYYLYPTGQLAVSTTIDGYVVNENGEWI